MFVNPESWNFPCFKSTTKSLAGRLKRRAGSKKGGFVVCLFILLQQAANATTTMNSFLFFLSEIKVISNYEQELTTFRNFTTFACCLLLGYQEQEETESKPFITMQAHILCCTKDSTYQIALYVESWAANIFRLAAAITAAIRTRVRTL